MEEIINALRALFATYGFRAGAIVVATIIVVNVVKKPIVKKGEALSVKTGVDKSVLTRYVTFLPVPIAFVLEFAVSLVEANFAFAMLDFGKMLSSSILYAALATATYESVKKQLEAYAAAYGAGNVKPSKKSKIDFSSNGPQD